MRVVCDNCGASYKISDTKLTRDVNKATCRKCGHQIVIRRHERDSLSPDMVTATSEFEQTELAPSGMHAFGPGAGYADEVQSTLMNRHNVDHRESTVPRDIPRHSVGVVVEPVRAVPPPVYQPPPPPNYGAAVAIPPQNTGVVPPHLQPPMQQQPIQPPMQQQPMQQPAPAPLQQAPQGYAQQPWRPHDPAGDLSLVMMASFGAAIGAAVLASSTTEMQTLVGLGIALWSSITSLMVLVTGDRGRKEAKVFLSMALALVLAVGATAAFRTTGLAAGTTPPAIAKAEPVEPPVAPPVAATTQPTEPVTPPVVAPPAETPPPVVTPPVVEPPPVVETPPPPVEKATPPVASSGSSSGSRSGSSSSSSSSSGSRSGSSSPSSSGSSSTSSSPSTARSSGSSSSSGSSGSSGSSSSSSSSSTPSTSSSAAAAPESTGVPVTVLQTMLSTNKSVKTCFGLYRQETGELPKGRINVNLTIQPSGTVSYAAIDGGQYAGTSLDSCLGGAIKKIQFPPFSGEAATYKYPFIL